MVKVSNHYAPAMAVVIEPGDGERLGTHIRMKLDRPELCVTEATVGPDFVGTGPHYHERHVDAFYVLEGELELILGTETLRAGPGMSIAVPPGIIHGFTSSAPGTTRYLNLHAPDSGFAEYLRRRIAGDASATFDSIDVDEPSGPAEADVVEAGGGERLEASDRTITVRAAHPQLCYLEFDARDGFGPVLPHRHDGSIDSFYVLEGELGLLANGDAARFAPGSFVAALPEQEHGILQVESPVGFLNFHAPDDGFAAFIRGT
jgi:quercetin dioxygenase-like cupin family protein